jgi:hypothetical protein
MVSFTLYVSVYFAILNLFGLNTSDKYKIVSIDTTQMPNIVNRKYTAFCDLFLTASLQWYVRHR